METGEVTQQVNTYHTSRGSPTPTQKTGRDGVGLWPQHCEVETDGYWGLDQSVYLNWRAPGSLRDSAQKYNVESEKRLHVIRFCLYTLTSASWYFAYF